MYKFSAISVTESSWAVPISNVDSHITDRTSLYRVALRVSTTSLRYSLSLDYQKVRYTLRGGGGGGSYETGGDARRLAQGCKFRILVSTQNFVQSRNL